jgi:hypothetical protein
MVVACLYGQTCLDLNDLILAKKCKKISPEDVSGVLGGKRIEQIT